MNIRRPKKKSNVLNDKWIKSCLSRFDSGAYSRLQFLCAVSHSVCAHTESLQLRIDNSSNSNSSEDEGENRQAPVPAAPTSGASESATAAAATTSDDCCEVCIMAPRHVLASHWCRADIKHVDSIQGTQWWKRKVLEIDLPVNHTISHYFIMRPNVVQRAGQLSLPHVAISKTERKRTANIKPMSSSYNTPCIKHKLSSRTLLQQVSRCPPLRYGAACSCLAMSVPSILMVSRCHVSRF